MWKLSDSFPRFTYSVFFKEVSSLIKWRELLFCWIVKNHMPAVRALVKAIIKYSSFLRHCGNISSVMPFRASHLHFPFFWRQRPSPSLFNIRINPQNVQLPTLAIYELRRCFNSRLLNFEFMIQSILVGLLWVTDHSLNYLNYQSSVLVLA